MARKSNQNIFDATAELFRFKDDPNVGRYSDRQLEAMRDVARKRSEHGLALAIIRGIRQKEVLRNGLVRSEFRQVVVDDRSVDGIANLRIEGPGVGFTLRTSRRTVMTKSLLEEVAAKLAAFAKDWQEPVMADDTKEIVFEFKAGPEAASAESGAPLVAASVAGIPGIPPELVTAGSNGA